MSEFVQRTVAKAALPIAFLACAILSAALFYDYFQEAGFGIDFGVYWRVANAPAQQAYLWGGNYPFPYAPTMLLWVAPLSVAPKDLAFLIFTIASMAALALACRAYLSKTALALMFLSPAFARGVYSGQITTALAAALLWSCGTKNRIAAGCAFGLIASVKPQLVIMAPLLFVLNRDWRALVASGLALLSAVLLASFIFGFERWPEWLASMGHFHSAVSTSNIINLGVTPAMWAERLGLSPPPFIVAGSLAGAMIVFRCRSMPPVGQAAAIVAGSLLAAPYGLSYDLTPVLPFLALAAVRGRILAPLALIAEMNPLPLAIVTYELLRHGFSSIENHVRTSFGSVWLAPGVKNTSK